MLALSYVAAIVSIIPVPQWVLVYGPNKDTYIYPMNSWVGGR